MDERGKLAGGFFAGEPGAGPRGREVKARWRSHGAARAGEGGRKDDCVAALRCTPRGVRPGALRAEVREGSQKIPAGRSPRRCTKSPAAGTADTPSEHVSLRVELRLDSRQDALPYPGGTAYARTGAAKLFPRRPEVEG
jgi:hypothetical protein